MKKLLTLVIIFMATALSSCKSDDSDVLSDVLSIVHVSKGGTLASVLTKSGLDANQLVSLKISGILNAEDFMTIRNMNALINLDISEVEITALPEKAFYESVNIRHLILPRNLMTIGEAMFYKSGLESIVIPIGVETIETSAFQACSSLRTVTFEEGSQLKTIGGGYNGLTYLGAFSDCTSLTSIEIPASVEIIGEAAFKGCSKLANVTFEKGSQLKTIGEQAFSNCVNLMTVDMSECTQVEFINSGAFRNNSKLQLFKIGTKIPPECYGGVFEGISPYSILKVPSGCMKYYRSADGWNSFANIEELTE